MQIIQSKNQSLSLSTAAGPLPYKLTNDYLFHALLQENNKVLKGLICSLLHLSPFEVFSVVIMNPIELGTSITQKTFFLDIKVMMNDHTMINLEMQVVNTGNWPERSLSYLCRSFDNLNKGQNYSEVKPVIHIGLLDFTLFPDHPEFTKNELIIPKRTYSISKGNSKTTGGACSLKEIRCYCRLTFFDWLYYNNKGGISLSGWEWSGVGSCLKFD